MKYTAKAIDSLNDSIWQSRFGENSKVEADGLKVLKRAEKEHYAKGIAYAKLNISISSFLQSKNDNALKFLTEALHWFNNNKDEKGYARALLIKGNIYESFGDYEKTLSLWLEAYKVSKETKDIESEGESCSQLGLIYSRLCNFQKAFDFFSKGLKIRNDLGDENGAASSLNRIGMVLRQIKKYDESLEYYFRSLDIRKKNKQLSAIPWTLLGIANTYEEMKKFPESLEYYEIGMIDADKRCILQCLMGIGRVYSRMRENDKAEDRLSESLRMAMELKSMFLVAEAHSALAEHYELSNQPEKALKSFKQYLKAKETFQSSDSHNKLSNIEVAHAIEKAEQEKEIFRLRNVELKEAYDIIEEKNKDITASINYASRIQRAMLPDTKEIRGLTNRCFILYLPKDIVSGDFYWFSKVNSKLVIVAGDCTGHGVPGALMSMLGISLLEEIVNKREILESDKILNELRDQIQRALHQRGDKEGTKDGMDISLCIIDDKLKSIEFSGAYNNLYFIRYNELTEYKADRMPIGIFDHSGQLFTKQEIIYQPGDTIYMFSDGYADQFGGPNIKKFRASVLKEVLVKNSNLPLQKQKEKLEKEFYEWKGENGQIDDVLIFGLKL
jgi:serine phosphatase RsbU (regulator of sigma subunit)